MIIKIVDLNYLLEKVRGESVPDVSRAAYPKAFTGCSVSGDVAIDEAC